MDLSVDTVKWRYTSHAFTARTLLVRLAGIPEERLQHWTSDPPESILDALPHL